MLRSPRPAMSASQVYSDCRDRIADSSLKARIAANTTLASNAASDYANAGAAGSLGTVAASTYPLQGGAVKSDFDWLYEKRLTRSSAGRKYYKRLLAENRRGRCALCNVRDASTLDHHLPKSQHPIFAVLPDNLLPACGHCNHGKLASTQPTLNAYFDDLGSGPWLKASVIHTVPAVIEFSIDIQSCWSSDLAARATAHFDLFNLQELYSYQASRQLTGIRKFLTDEYATGGAAGVQRNLAATAASWASGEPNSWESALYEALASSTWFCGGGFK